MQQETKELLTGLVNRRGAEIKRLQAINADLLAALEALLAKYNRVVSFGGHEDAETEYFALLASDAIAKAKGIKE